MLPKKVTLSGGITIGSCSSACGLGGADCAAVLAATIFGSTFESARSLNSPAAFVDLLAGTGLTTVKFLALRVSGGIVELRVSSAFGSTQIIPVSSVFVLANDLAGSELTAVAIRGTATVELIVAGS